MSSEPFSSVVAEHGAMVLRVCRAMLSPSDADDAWSDAFLAALRAYPDLDPAANVAAWLTTIAQRKAIDILRRNGRVAARSTMLNEVVHMRTALPEAESRDLIDSGLRAALGELSERQRIAVIAHHVAGFPYSEIAQMLGSSPEAARRSAADGIAKLRTHYSGVSPSLKGSP